jgi:hypothetical protein
VRHKICLSCLLVVLFNGCRDPVDLDSNPVDLASIRVGQDGYISWEDAKRVLLHPDADTVMQAHSLDVKISMKDGTVFRTKEPKIDDVWRFIKANGLKDRINYDTE